MTTYDRRSFLKLVAICLLGAGCQLVPSVTESIGDVVDHGADKDCHGERFYIPAFDLTRINRVDY